MARDLARRTGESITDATRKALEERLLRLGGERNKALFLDDLAAIRKRCAGLPVVDGRSPDEILGYDDLGLPAWTASPMLLP